MDGSNHLVKSGYYDECTLYGEKTTDEDGHTLTVFTDKLGRKILERREANYGYNDTYYVYNDLGQLRFVLSPEYQNAGKKAIYAYEYRYDNRGNIVKKILPQCEYIQYWYDKADRMTFMQDVRMRQQGLYCFYLYDNLSRVVAEGTCSGGNRGKTVRNAVFNASASGLLGTGYTVDNSLNLTSPLSSVTGPAAIGFGLVVGALGSCAGRYVGGVVGGIIYQYDSLNNSIQNEINRAQPYMQNFNYDGLMMPH